MQDGVVHERNGICKLEVRQESRYEGMQVPRLPNRRRREQHKGFVWVQVGSTNELDNNAYVSIHMRIWRENHGILVLVS